jgi:pimeloyl-ACP methyl ester carboxylesterase
MPLARVNGININYTIEGDGIPLVLIMGLGGGQTAWRRQIPAFKESYRVVTFDNRGVGKSDKPEGIYTPGIMAEDTIRLMDFLKIQKAHILGMSMGGLIAQEIAINYPQRVMKLVLGSTFACYDDAANGPTPHMIAAGELPPKQAYFRLIDACFNTFIFRYIFIPLLKFRARRIKESEITGIRAQVEGVKGFHSLDRLPLIKAPTLVLTGTGDRVIKPGSSETISQKIPGARLVKIKNGSHVVCVEKSKEFNQAVLGFLKGT